VTVLEGVTETVPAAARPLPTPWSIWTLVALVTFQIRVAVPPAIMLVGLAVNATMLGVDVEVVVDVVEVVVEKGHAVQDIDRSNNGVSMNNFFITASSEISSL